MTESGAPGALPGGFPEEHRGAAETCEVCPNLCRARCPVAAAERSEAAVPAFKMRLARAALDGEQPLTASAAQVFYKCTGCASSRSACRHDVGVAEPLRRAREVAVEAGVAPASVAELAARFEAAGSPYSCDLSAAARLALPEASEAGSERLWPGCAGLAREPEEGQAAWLALRALEGEAPGRPPGMCCGYPLYALGLKAAYEAHAERLRGALVGVERLVVGSPTCAWLLRQRAGARGWPEVVTVSERLAQSREAIAAGRRVELGARILYHDACYLGRRMGVSDAPRQVIAAATGRWPREFEARREQGRCAGAGGGYAWTHRAESLEVAAQSLAAAPEDRRRLRLVSCCPSSRRQFRQSDPSQPVAGLGTLVAESLGLLAE